MIASTVMQQGSLAAYRKWSDNDSNGVGEAAFAWPFYALHCSVMLTSFAALPRLGVSCRSGEEESGIEKD